MAWLKITCPYCRERIPLSSIRCPHCRSVIPHECGEKERRRLLILLLFFIAVLVLGIAFIIVWLILV